MEFTGQQIAPRKMVTVRVQAINELKVLPSARTLLHLQIEVKVREEEQVVQIKETQRDIRTLDQVAAKVTQIKWPDKGLMVETLLHNLSSVRMLCLEVVLLCTLTKDSRNSSKCTKTPRIR